MILQLLETYEYYGDCLLNFKDFDGALFYYKKISLYQNKNSNDTPYEKASILSKIGNSYQGQEKYQEAIKYYQQAFAIIYKDSFIYRELCCQSGFQINSGRQDNNPVTDFQIQCTL